jgi:hypothetical protein
MCNYTEKIDTNPKTGTNDPYLIYYPNGQVCRQRDYVHGVSENPEFVDTGHELVRYRITSIHLNKIYSSIQMNRYSCGFNGQCEPDADGIFESLEDCEAECQAREAKDINYLIYEYDPVSALELGPHDRAEVVRRLTDQPALTPDGALALLRVLQNVDLTPDEFQEMAEILTTNPELAPLVLDNPGHNLWRWFDVPDLAPFAEIRVQWVRGFISPDDNRFRIVMIDEIPPADRRRLKRGMTCNSYQYRILNLINIAYRLNVPSPESSDLPIDVQRQNVDSIPFVNHERVALMPDDEIVYVNAWVIVLKRNGQIVTTEPLCNAIQEELTRRGWVG